MFLNPSATRVVTPHHPAIDAASRFVDRGLRLIAPVGPDGRQELYLYTKGEARTERRSLGPVSFVPLLSGLQR